MRSHKVWGEQPVSPCTASAQLRSRPALAPAHLSCLRSLYSLSQLRVSPFLALLPKGHIPVSLVASYLDLAQHCFPMPVKLKWNICDRSDLA